MDIYIFVYTGIIIAFIMTFIGGLSDIRIYNHQLVATK